MTDTESRQAIWQRELKLALSDTHWRQFALELRTCALFLDEAFQAATSGNPGPVAPRGTFFAPKFCRLLLGLALENLVKSLLLSGPKQAAYLKEGGGITFRDKGHDLVWLLGEAEVPLDDATRLYVRGWSISAVWFGKYPFPLSVGGVLDEYVALESSEALHQRVACGDRDLILHDVLHGSIGASERSAFEAVWNELMDRGAA